MEPEEELEEIIIFKKFDVVSDSSDHYFLNHPMRKDDGYLEPPTITSIKHEWDLLEQNLHQAAYDSIFIRAYNYIDLMRAVIVGQKFTPYARCLFFFDIWLPPNFPTEPPKLHYHSHGIDLNSNLDKSGNVSLPFINTRYRGDDSEESALLEILKTIQDSVLCAHPYFSREPRLRYEYGSRHEAVEYNNHVIKLCCNKMLETLKNPPKYFEDFVRESFRMHAHSFLVTTRSEYDRGNSDTKRMVKLLYDAFEANGIHDEHFSDLRNKQISKRKNGVLWGIWRNWRKA